MTALGRPPLVSVVIPTHRRVAFLAEALDSVCSQTFTDVEIIVVEDGSHHAADVLGAYGPRVRSFWQTQQGPAAARNAGAAVARGEWLAFLDDDDVWLPSKLALQHRCAENSPGCVLVHTDVHQLRPGPDGEPIRTRRAPLSIPSGHVTAALFQRNFIVTSTVLIRKDAFLQTGGFHGDYTPSEDYHLWLRASLLGRIDFVPEPLAVYRFHGDNLSRSDLILSHARARMLEASVRQIPRLREICGRASVARRLHDAHRECAWLGYYASEYSIAAEHFLGAFTWWPSDVAALGRALACFSGPRGLDVLRAIKRVRPGRRPRLTPHRREEPGPVPPPPSGTPRVDPSPPPPPDPVRQGPSR